MERGFLPGAESGPEDAEDGGREDPDWTPERLRRALEGFWRVAEDLLGEVAKERP